ENVIRIDPYNKAARRGLERVAQARADYYRAAYDHTRAELLAQVDAAWELSVPRLLTDEAITGMPNQGQSFGASMIINKLRTIVLPMINFEDTSVEEAVDFLRARSAELDPELDPAKKGINFVIRKPRTGGSGDAGLDADAGGLGSATDPGALRIKELRLRNVPLEQALKYICEQTRLQYKVDDFAVTLVPATETDVDLIHRTFQDSPDFQAYLVAAANGADSGGGAMYPYSSDSVWDGLIQACAPLKELLEHNGVSFQYNASATNSGSTRIVDNAPN